MGMREAQDGVRRVPGAGLGVAGPGRGSAGGGCPRRVGASPNTPSFARAPSSARLSELLVFKGGNALDFVWSPNHSTIDLDFSADIRAEGAAALDEARLEGMPSRALDVSGRETGVVVRVHSVRRQPPGEGKTFVTYTARIGYALPDEGRNRTRLDAGQPSTNVVPVEVSINEPIGADADVAVGDRSLRVSTPGGIVAEKLKAFCSRKGRSATGPKTSRTWRTSYVGAPLSISTKSPGSCWRRPEPGTCPSPKPLFGTPSSPSGRATVTTT